MGASEELPVSEDIEVGLNNNNNNNNKGTIQRQVSVRSEKSPPKQHSSSKASLKAEDRQSSRILKTMSGDLNRPLLRSKSRGLNEPSSFVPTLFTLVVVLGPLSLGLAVSTSCSTVLFSLSYVSFWNSMQLGYTSPTQADIVHDLNLSLSQYSFFGALVNLGAMVGAITSGRIADIFGRKGALLAAAVPNLIGWFMISISNDLHILYTARFLTGLGGGIVSFVVPTYIAEISPKHLRGTLGTFNQLAVTIGIMLAYMGGLFLRWRMLAIASTIPGLLLLLGLCFITETPRWLGNAERKEDLVLTLERLRGKDYNNTHELSDIMNAVEMSRLQPNVKFSELFRRRLLRPLIAGIGLHFFQQFSGINGVMLYAGEIFKTVGFESANTASLILAILAVLVTASAAVLMDQAGRRLLLLVSFGGMVLSSFLVGLSFYFRDNLPEHSSSGMNTFINVLALSSLLSYVAAFAFGAGAIPWIIMSEVFPSRVKALAGSVATLVNWSCAWAVTLSFNFLLDWSSPGCFWLFGAVSLCAVAFVAIFVPETRGRTLEQIEASFK